MDKTSYVTSLLVERIDTERYPAGEAVPSERLLSEELGLSRTTVRRAIDNLVQDGRLIRRPGRGTFVPEKPAQTSTSGSGQRHLAVIIPTFANPYYGEMIDGMEKQARSHEMRIVAGQSDYSAESESEQLLQSAADPNVCGALVVPGGVGRPSRGAREFIRSGKAFVYVGRWPLDVPVDGVRVDYRLAARRATQHLIDLGHERIAYVEGLPNLPGFSPFEGFSEMMRERKLPIRPELVRISDQPSEKAGREAIAAMVAEGVHFTAVFGRNDVTTLGIMQGLRDAGLRVPDDVSVTSIANSLLARSMDPPLTCINPEPATVGRLALRLLWDRLQGSYTGPPIRMLLEPGLIKRGSTAAPRAGGR